MGTYPHGRRILESSEAGKVEVVERHRRHKKLAGFGCNRFSWLGERVNPLEDS